ncbi:MAG: nicotinate-nicotinamide nucleotide adenylyltransferase, partial [Thermotogota bacterium]
IIVQKMLDYIGNLKRLFIIPAGCSPFKRTMEDQAPFEYRYKWCSSIFATIDGIDTLDIEREDAMDNPSYTYQTIQRFYKQFHEYPILILGEDSLASFHKWKHYERILERCELAVFQRRGYSGKINIDNRYLEKVTVYDTPYLEISSTEIRKRISKNKSIKGYVPETLEREIIEQFKKLSDMNAKS